VVGYISPPGVQGFRAELLAGIVYLGHLYAGESGQFRPLIFLGPVWYDAVRCGVSSDPIPGPAFLIRAPIAGLFIGSRALSFSGPLLSVSVEFCGCVRLLVRERSALSDPYCQST